MSKKMDNSTRYAITIRVSNEIRELIDESASNRRPVAVTRQHWVLEAIIEKLQRENPHFR